MDPSKTEPSVAEQGPVTPTIAEGESSLASKLTTLRNGLWTVFGLWMGVALYYRFMAPPAPRFVGIVTVAIAGAAVLVWAAEWVVKKRSQRA